MSIILLLAAALLPLIAAFPSTRQSTNRTVFSNHTIDNSQLKTWWHTTGEINTKSPVQPENVRQSHLYSVQVGTSTNASFYDSFVYESIPRGGKPKLLDPRDPSSTTTDDDGITIEPDVDLTMAWSEFLYSKDVTVKISRLDGKSSNASNVIIRPKVLSYNVTASNGDIFIHVPYSDAGSRFSVEFQDDNYVFHDSCAGTSCGLIQNEDSKGFSFANHITKNDPVISVEPRNALLIFASPFPSQDLVPSQNSSSILQVSPGLVNDLNTTQASTVVFNPGVYYMTSTAHARLNESVHWVYFAPGSYVKGAIQFTSTNPGLKATGHGVLSGEQYVYQANTQDGYKNKKSNDDCLRMWSGWSMSGVQQTFTIAGMTVNEPPFNSMDFKGELDSLSVEATDYKQVGAWYGQTDGMQNYPGTHARNMFYHSNDDTIKTYYSNVLIENVVVWKGAVAPTVQFGWASRDISNITVTNIDIIHSRYANNGSHPSIIGANQWYDEENEFASNTANTSNTIHNFTVANVRAEGISGNLLRIVPLQNFDNFVVENVTIEEFPDTQSAMQQSELPIMTDEKGNKVSLNNIQIKGYSVNGKAVTTDANNYQADQLGALNIPSNLIQSGAVTIE
ncbi:MAG: hypothetical protein Q9160_008069 [Pyrenula sp. 1 TL-2023]